MKLQPQAGSQYGLPQPLQNSFPAPVLAKRAPTATDTGHPIGRIWVYKGSNAYILEEGVSEPTESYGEAEWTAESGENKLRVRWGADGEFEYPHISGTIDGNEVEIKEKARMRKWRTAEIIAAAYSADLTLSAHYGDFAADSTDEVAQSIALSGDTGLGLHQCFCFKRA